MLVLPPYSSSEEAAASSSLETIDVVSTGMDGCVKFWRFSPGSCFITQGGNDALELLTEVALFAGPITASAVSSDGKWLFVAGECGAAADGKMVSSQIKAVSCDGSTVKEVGGRGRSVSHLHCTLRNQLLVPLMKEDDKDYGEVWVVSDMDQTHELKEIVQRIIN